ncbi:MAG: cytochrome c maturation protein CcmE [Acidimicrobiia bacterium]|nr:cytochrome c maturation protein CcmE [Acidimicrobiia bacterium]
MAVNPGADDHLGRSPDELGDGGPEAPDDASVDLRPRTFDRPAARRSPAKKWAGVAVLLVVLGIGGVAVAQALNEAALYFRNVDEAIAERSELGDSRFRIQGTVVPEGIEAYPGGATFSITYNGATTLVEHSGDPQELFQPDIPVVLEGRWSGSGDQLVFVSDRMLVKHDENYVADHGDRIDDAEQYGDGEGYDDADGATSGST